MDPTRPSLLVLATSLTLAGAACDPRDEPPPPFPIVVRVTSARDSPVPGASLSLDGRRIATSDRDGTMTLTLPGREGDVRDFSIACPEGFESPRRPLQVTLRQLSGAASAPQFEATCRPLHRSVVVAVRARGGSDLPVLLRGKEVARTDSAGIAHARFSLQEGEQLLLELDTRSDASLHPANPQKLFVVGDRDDVFLFDAPLARASTHVRRARPTATGPRRIE